MDIKHMLIGSRLFQKLFPDNEKIQKRCSGDDRDYDVLVFDLLYYKNNNVKNHFKKLYNSNKVELHYIEPIYPFLNDSKYRLQDVLFTLKASHVPWDSIHKEKTFYDLFLMSEEKCKIILDLFYDLNEYWTSSKGEKWRADFTKESSDFFDDAVSRENIHDELHEQVKHLDKPAFKYLQEPNQTTVWVCPSKFASCSEEIRRYVIIEEAQTLALERLLIPGIKSNPTIAYNEFIKGLILRLAPLWMVPYITENLNYFLTYKEKFYDRKF